MYGDTLARLAARLAGLDVSNTVVRFDPTRPIPIEVVTEIVTADQLNGSAPSARLAARRRCASFDCR